MAASGLTAALERTLAKLGIGAGARVAVAVSGGADSLALALLMHKHCTVFALTVDHGLRAESGAEAQQVGKTLRRFGIAHHILEWQGDKPSGNIQAEARAARYRLLAEWCAANDVPVLATAHHMDDQAETLLLRLARGSGVYGLAGMPPSSPCAGFETITLIRPLLDHPKAALKNWLDGEGVAWVEDPSNENMQFDRVKVRQLLQNPPLEGLRAERLAETAKRLRRSRDALEFYEREWLARAVSEHEPGFLTLDPAALSTAPQDIVLRGLASLCRVFEPTAYTPRMEKVERLLETLTGSQGGQTLYGAQFTRSPRGITICREAVACEASKPIADGHVWDNRFEISAGGDTRGLEIGALGEKGWGQAVIKWPEVREINMPHEVRLSLPAVFSEGQLRALPLMGYSDLENVTVRLSRKPLIRPKK